MNAALRYARSSFLSRSYYRLFPRFKFRDHYARGDCKNIEKSIFSFGQLAAPIHTDRGFSCSLRKHIRTFKRASITSENKFAWAIYFDRQNPSVGDIYRPGCLFRGNAERPESRMYIQEYRGGVGLEMDDQVIRVKRANDCPALLKSFRWKAARRRESATENGWRIQHGELSRRGIYYGTTSWHSYFSLHSYLVATTGIQLVRARRCVGIVRLIQVFDARGCSGRVHSGSNHMFDGAPFVESDRTKE